MNMKTITLVGAALAALAVAGCGTEEVTCANGTTYATCDALDEARIAAGSGTQSSAALELCWENNCDETQPFPQY
jgi:outer membrane lipoprotein SlyB